MIPLSGAEYVYIGKAFGSFPAFLFSWTGILISRPGSIAIIITTCGDYCMTLFFNEWKNTWVSKSIALVLLWILTFANAASTSISKHFQNVTTVLKMAALIAIGVLSLVLYNTGRGIHENLAPEQVFKGSSLEPGNYALAAFSALWAYDGWNNLNLLAGEVKNPAKVLPLSIIVGTIGVTVFYVIANVSYFAMLPLDLVAETTTIGLEFGKVTLGSVGTIVLSLVVIISTIGATNASILSGSRISFVAGQNNHAPAFLADVDSATGTPSNHLLTRKGTLPTNSYFDLFGANW